MQTYVPPAAGDRVVAFSDYWHERPYGAGVIAEAFPLAAYDSTRYYRVVLDAPVQMASPPRAEREIVTSHVLREAVAA